MLKDASAKRMEFQVSLRKQDWEQRINQRRLRILKDSSSNNPTIENEHQSSNQWTETLSTTTASREQILKSLQNYSNALSTHPPNRFFELLTRLKWHTDSFANSPLRLVYIECFIESGLVEKLLMFLSGEARLVPQTFTSSTFILSDLCTGEDRDLSFLHNAGMIGLMKQCLEEWDRVDEDGVVNVLWGLSNYCSEGMSSARRYAVFNDPICESVIKVINARVQSFTNKSFPRVAAWICSILIRPYAHDSCFEEKVEKNEIFRVENFTKLSYLALLSCEMFREFGQIDSLVHDDCLNTIDYFLEHYCTYYDKSLPSPSADPPSDQITPEATPEQRLCQQTKIVLRKILQSKIILVITSKAQGALFQLKSAKDLDSHIFGKSIRVVQSIITKLHPKYWALQIDQNYCNYLLRLLKIAKLSPVHLDCLKTLYALLCGEEIVNYMIDKSLFFSVLLTSPSLLSLVDRRYYLYRCLCVVASWGEVHSGLTEISSQGIIWGRDKLSSPSTLPTLRAAVTLLEICLHNGDINKHKHSGINIVSKDIRQMVDYDEFADCVDFIVNCEKDKTTGVIREHGDDQDDENLLEDIIDRLKSIIQIYF